MTRRTLDLVVCGGGVVLALLFVAIGLVLGNQASFAREYVKEQLGDQKIVFATTDKLTEEEKAWKPGSTCLISYAGQTMGTGKQAECYANFYIKMHMERSANNAGFPGETYATLGGIRTQLSADIAAAKEKNDALAAADLQKRLDSATSLRTTMQTGETLRGLLLTSYGFSVFGEKAALASNIAYAAAAVLGVLVVAGLVHALLTPGEAQAWGSGQVPAGRVPLPRTR